MDKKIIQRLIDKFDEKQLRELIFYIADRNGSAGENILEYCCEKDNEKRSDGKA